MTKYQVVRRSYWVGNGLNKWYSWMIDKQFDSIEEVNKFIGSLVYATTGQLEYEPQKVEYDMMEITV